MNPKPSVPGETVEHKTPRCVIQKAVHALSRDDWEAVLRRGGLALRQDVGKLLEVAVRGKQLNAELHRIKATSMSDARLHGLAEVLVAPVRLAAVQLIGTSYRDPTLDDWRRIWPALSNDFSPNLARLLLHVAVDRDWPTAATARAFLAEIDPHTEFSVAPTFSEIDSPAEPSLSDSTGLRSQAEHIDGLRQRLGEARARFLSVSAEVGKGLQRGEDCPARAAEEAVTTAAVIGDVLGELAPIIVNNGLDVDIFGHLSGALQNAAEILRGRADEHELELADASEVQRRVTEAAALVAPLLTVQGPARFHNDLVVLREIAVPPVQPEKMNNWLELIPLLDAFIVQLSGGPPMSTDHSQAFSDLTTPTITGLAFSGQLRLEPVPKGAVAEAPTIEAESESGPGLNSESGPAASPPGALRAAQEARAEEPREVAPSSEVEEHPSLSDVAVTEKIGPIQGEETKNGEEIASDEELESAVAAVEVWPSLLRLIDDGHLGSAAWAASARDPGWGTTLEVLAIAEGLRGNAGSLSELLWTRMQGLSRVPEGPANQVLCAALCLAATVAPFSGAAEVLEQAAAHAPMTNGLRDLCNTVVEATRLGLIIGAGPITDTRSSAVQDSLRDARAAARQQLSTAETRRIKYQRATRVYQAWMAENGLLGSLLVAVRDDDRGRVDEVRHRVVLLNDREIARAIDDEDARLRGANATARIIASARQKLVDWAHEVLEIVDSWSRAVVAWPQASGPSANAELVSRVRDAGMAVSRHVAKEISGSEVDELALADHCVRRAADILLRRIDEGLPTSAEPLAHDLLDSWLPFVYEASLTRESWPNVPEVALPGLLVAPYRSAETAYAGFAAKRDHAGSGRLLAALQMDVSGEVKMLNQRRARDLRVARAALGRRADRIQGEFDELEAFPGALETERAVVIRGLLVEASENSSDDLLAVEARLAEAEQEFGQVRREQGKLLIDAISHADISEPDSIAVRKLLEEGALSAAYERFDATRHNPLQKDRIAARYSELQQRFWTKGLNSAQEPEVIEAAILALREGQPFAPFGDGPTERAERLSNAASLSAWTALFREKREGDFGGRLRSVLALLAIQGPTPREDRTKRMRGRGTHLALDVENANPVLPVMSYEFGSNAYGRYRIMVVWEQMPPEELVSLVLNDHNMGPYILLYRGVLTQRQRQALTQRIRQEDAASMRLLIVDDAVALTMAFSPDAAFATLEHLTLPFAQAAVFAPDVAGNVPPELFRGRRRELAEVMNQNGGCFVYGGRQVGKSALLRQAVREVEQANDPDRRAIYLDVKGLGLGQWRDVDEFWLDLLEELSRAGIVTDRSSKAARGEAAVLHIRNWLEAQPARRLLVLLDECDELLDADARKDFAIVERFRALMGVTDRRFKVVLAGLHQVQRFERQRNVPLAHLTQQPIQVGPLQPNDAVTLICDPLLAFGYVLDDAATWRLLAETNHQAGMIQFFGQALMRALNERSTPRDAFPMLVDRAFVDRVYQEQGLAEQMRRRFMLTINLDESYRCIAFVIALRNLQLGMMADYADSELQTDCAYWWPAGFETMRPTLFLELVEEMIGLGVLVRVNRKLRIRNPNIVRMLGTQSQVEAELIEFETVEPSRGFEASQYRRQLPDRRRSPLTEEELARLVEVDLPGLAFVGGSVPLGIDKVSAALKAKLKDRQDIDLIGDVAAEAAAARISAVRGRTVLIVDCRDVPTDRILASGQAVQAVLNKMPYNTLMRRVIFVLGPGAFELWSDPHRAPAGLEGALRIGLRRLTSSSLTAWSTEESLEMDRSSAQAVLAVTGGWPILVDRAIAGKRHKGWRAAAEEARQEAIADAEFVKSALGGVPGVEALVSLLADLGEPVTWPFLSELADQEPGAKAQEGLQALQLVEESQDGTVRLEAALADAWRSRELP